MKTQNHFSHTVFALLVLMGFLCISRQAIAAEWHVAPDGLDTADGTISTPFATIRRAQQSASPGDTVYIHGGTYTMQPSHISLYQSVYAYVTVLDKSGVEGKPITYAAYQDEKPTFDFTNVTPAGYRVGAFLIAGSWLHLRGIEVVGVQVTITTHTQSECFEVTGSDNILEQLSIHDGQGIGVYITGSGARNLVLNCDAYNNWDYTSEGGAGGNVDGFGCHGNGTGNVFRGCRAWYNSDDGFDCINLNQSVVFENCWALYNGYSKDGGSRGDGTGFKAGGYGVSASTVPNPIPRNTVRHCIAVRNKRGFYANHHPGGGDWYNNSAYNNGVNYNFLCYNPNSDPTLPGVDVAGFDHVIRNNLSHGTTAGNALTNLAGTGNTRDHNAIPANSGEILSDTEFESVDFTQLFGPRQAGGDLPVITFLKPVKGSALIDGGVDVGLVYYGVAPDIGAIERNITPVITSEPTATATQYIAFNHAITADNNPSDFEASGLPAGLSIDEKTGVISGKAQTTGIYTVTISVSNDGGTATGTLMLTVNEPPLAESPVITRADAVAGTISGVAEAGAAVEVFNHGVSIGTTLADDTGNWSLPIDGGLPSGTLVLTATAGHFAGYTSPVSAAYLVNMSLSAPAITSITPDTGVSSTDGITNAANITLHGTAADNASVNIMIGNDGTSIGQVAATGGVWRIAWDGTAVSDGTYIFYAVVSDDGASSPASAVYTVTLDRIAPEVKSITRHSPSTETITISTNAVIYRIEFTEDVSGLAPGHFEIATTDTVSGVITAINAVSAGIYDVGAGSFSGVGNLRLDLRASATGLADMAGNVISSAAYTDGASYTRKITSKGGGVWLNAAGGQWSAASNWEENFVADEGYDVYFDTIDITGAVTVGVDSTRAVKSMYFGDTGASTAGAWVLDGNGNAGNVLNLAAGAALDVSGDVSLTLKASLGGGNGFTKINSGSLLYEADSSASLSGDLIVDGGLMRIGAGGVLKVARLTMTSTGRSELNMNGGMLIATDLATINTGNGTIFTMDSGTVRFEGGLTNANSAAAVVRMRGGSFYASDFSMPRSHALAADYTTGMIITGGDVEIGTLNLGTVNSGAAVSLEGGTLAVTGAIVLGNQTSPNRGGNLRVMGGKFISTDKASGIVLCAHETTANVSLFHSLGGESHVSRLTFGASGNVASGTGTFLINGGTTYIGEGGLVKNATGTYVAVVTLQAGILGAADDWGTSMPMALSTNNASFIIKAADADNNPHDITLNGVISGASNRGFTKTGGGALTLGGVNTFAGAVNVSAGTLLVRGSLYNATNAVTVSSGAYIGGSGTINRPVTLSAGAGLAFTPGQPLTIASNRALTKNGAGKVPVRLIGTLATDQATLATFASSSNLASSDFDPITGPGWTATLTVTSGTLQLTVTPDTNALDNAIAAAQATLNAASTGIGHGQYPQAASDALAAAIVAATAAGQGTPTDAQIIVALNALQAALDTFADTPLNTVDFDALDDALATADALLAVVQDPGANSIGNGDGQYPQAALNVLKTAIDTVKSVRGKQYVTQAELDVALSALQNALTTFAGAVITVDFSALIAALDDATALRATAIEGAGHGQHAQADITALATAIDAAENVTTTLAVTQTQVDTAAAALQNTITVFTSATIDVDFSALDAETAAAAALLATADAGNGHGQYPQPAIDTFTATLATAQALSGQAGATPTQAAETLGTLQTAAATFAAARVIVDFSVLETAITAADTLHARASAGEGHGQHAQADINALAAAIDAALTAAAAPAPEQTAIDNARVTLQLAVAAFEATAQVVDFSALTTAITDAEALLATAVIGAAAGEYPQSAADAFAAVIGTVKAVAGKLGVTQTETDTARRMLETAVAAFESAQITAADVAAPRITRHPVAQTVRPGATASFTAAATGPGLRYQWQKDGANIIGATTDALFIINAKSADAGVYRVIVTNNHGAATSYDARLTLEEPPSDGGGGAPAWPLPALLATLLALRTVIRRRE